MTAQHTPITALRRSHEQLVALTEGFADADVTGPSYASEWTIAQVLSHLGSGAEIGLLSVGAARAGEPPPDQAAYEAVWDRWNAKSPREQAADCPDADRRLVETLEGIGEEEGAALKLTVGPMELDAVGYTRLRLAEHAVHTWDVAVMGDPTATVDAIAVEQLIDLLPMFAGFLGRAVGGPRRVHLTTTGPDRDLLLDIGTDAVRVAPWDDGADQGRVVLSAEAFLRLVYGRLDPDHTPPGVETTGIELDELRPVYPGF